MRVDVVIVGAGFSGAVVAGCGDVSAGAVVAVDRQRRRAALRQAPAQLVEAQIHGNSP